MAREGYSLADIKAVTDGDKDRTQDNFLWWVLILFFLAGGNGFGWNRNNVADNGALTRAEMTDGFNNQSVLRKLDGINSGLCDGFYAQNTAMLQGFSGVDKSLCCGFNSINNNITQLGYQMQNCCCETNRNIDAMRYENAKNTCDIIQSSNMNTQRIIDTMTQNTIQELRDNLQAAQLQLGNQAQTNTIINAVRPISQPAYITCSPYESVNPYRQGYGCGCATCGV